MSSDGLRIVVLGTAASNPYAGMAWMHMQYVEGLRRLGHDAYYIEATSTWPYDPNRDLRVCDSDFAVPYLRRVAERFGFGERWAYRRSYLDRAWLGPCSGRAEALLAESDLVLNLAGATRIDKEGLKVRRLVYVGTDPVYHEVTYASGLPGTRALLEEHDDVVTYGENIGTGVSPLPPLPRLRARTRQPVLLDLWKVGPPTSGAFTTVGNWKQEGRDIEFGGETYRWSKHHEFLKYLDLPRRTEQPLELALNLADPSTIQHGRGEEVRARGVEPTTRAMLEANGWRLRDARTFTTDPWPYREYICASRAEYTVARDLNVRLRTGWFSERSACYLAAGRPVVTQDTGFGTVLPTGEGLFAFSDLDDALAAIEAINSDYERHSRAARAIAAEYFGAERVLESLLEALDA